MGNRAGRLCGVVLFVSFCVFVFVPGAGAEESTEQLAPITVTATKTPRAEGLVTNSVDILEMSELENLVVTKLNLSEYLTYVPGTAVRVLSRNDANWGSFGGLGPKYSTFMLEGLPVDSFVEPQAIDPWALERIEVQRGPASVLYPNSLGMDFGGNQSPLAGTVNLLLRERVYDPQTKLALDYGTFNTFRGRLFHQNRIGQLHFFTGGNYESSDYTNYGTEDSWLNMIDDPEYEKKRIYWGSTYYFNDDTDHRVSVFAHFTQHDGDTGRPNREFKHKYATLNSKYVLPLDSGSLFQVRAGYRRYDRSWQEDSFPDSLALRSEEGVLQTIVPVDLAFSLEHGAGSVFTVGVDGQYVDYSTESNSGVPMTGNDAKSYQAGLYAQEELVLGDFVLRGGSRLSWTEHQIDLLNGQAPGDDNQSWTEVLWSAGVRYSGHAVFSPFANAGTSFVAPALKSVGGTLSAEDRGVAGQNGQLPNPELDPERGLGVDLGTDIVAASAKFTVRGFYNLVDDAIVENVVSENPSQSQSVNAGDLEAYGVELGIRQTLYESLDWFANYTYTESSIGNEIDADQDDAQTPFVPRHVGNVGLSASLPYQITFQSSLHLTDEIFDSSSRSNRRQFEAYELINARLSKKVAVREGADVEAYLEFYNISDNKYEMPWQFQDPGFSMLGGVKAVF